MADVNVEIEAPENTNAYDDEEYLRREQAVREGVASLWEIGGRPDNIAEAVKGGIEDALE
jgi:hypothetical protein